MSDNIGKSREIRVCRQKKTKSNGRPRNRWGQEILI